ncbi:hypothetical protein JCM18237_19080 [Halorubrum luteum]
MTDPEGAATDITRLVDQNGLVKLFANRVRARILATLLYADEPLSVARIADSAGITRSTTLEALERLERFDVLELEGTGVDESVDGEIDSQAFADATFALADDDELVETVRRVAELSTKRYYDP